MSNLTILGDTSGSVVLQAPAVAGSTTLTLPATTGTVVVNTTIPTFSAYQSTGTSYGNQVATKINFQSKDWDTNNFWDAANSKFVPTIAGYYYISTSVQLGNSPTRAFIGLYKNGSNYKWLSDNGSVYNCTGATQVYMNGTTDYAEIYLWVTGASTTTNAASVTWVTGYLVRAA
jgi:hypothetical protein